jgi:hypothetical protein
MKKVMISMKIPLINIEDVIKHFEKVSPFGRKLISEVGKILELILVLSAMNATSERTFSKLKLINDN